MPGPLRGSVWREPFRRRYDAAASTSPGPERSALSKPFLGGNAPTSQQVALGENGRTTPMRSQLLRISVDLPQNRIRHAHPYLPSDRSLLRSRRVGVVLAAA